MNEIADDLNITKANLYYYYPDKTSLIIDVISQLSETLSNLRLPLIEGFNGGVLGTMASILELHAEFMRKYYVLYINENLEWIKGQDFEHLIECLRNKDVDWICQVLQKGKDNGEIFLNDVEHVSLIILETIQGLALTRTMKDIITGIPNKGNIEEIVGLQKQAVELFVKGLGYTSIQNVKL